METNMTELLQKTFKFAVDLYAKYSYWLFVMVGIVVFVMIPINGIIKAIFKKSKSVQGERIRKCLSSLFVYAVSLGVLYLYQFAIGTTVPGTEEIAEHVEHNYNLIVVAQDTFSVGTLSMVMWWFIKLVVDVGFGPVVVKIATSKEFKTALAELGLDKPVVSSVLAAFDTMLSEKAAAANQKVGDYLQANDKSASVELQYLLSLYNVDKTKLKSYSDILMKLVKSDYTK